MATMLVCYYLLCLALLCLAENTGSKPPKIVTKGGNLVLQAGDDGNIVFEPDEGKQVFIGSTVLNISGSAAVKGEKGDTGVKGSPGKAGINGSQGAPGQNGTNGVKGDKGEPGPPGKYVNDSGNPGSKGEPGIKGVKGLKGEPGVTGVKGQNGTMGPRGPPGPNGTKGVVGNKGEPGPAGPPGPLFNTMNQSSVSCENATEYGLVKFVEGYLQVCTKDGWKKLSYLMDVCQEEANLPKMMYKAFQTSTFGILLQFNGNLKVNLSPRMNASNITAVYQSGSGRNVTQYEQSVMGKAIHLAGQEYVDLHGIPGDFWSGDEWSVMALFKIYPDGLKSMQIPIIGDGDPAANRGFHLGVKDQLVLYGFYSNDITSGRKLNYDRWHHVTWTWTKVNKQRKIFVNSAKPDKVENAAVTYQGVSGKTQIGTWWNGVNGLTTNVKIDTLYFINKAIDFYSQDNQQLCYAKAMSNQMP